MRGFEFDKQVEGVPGLHLGMNSFDAPHLLPESSAAYIQNLEVDRLGQRSRCRGMTTIGAVSAPSNLVAAMGMWTHWDQNLGRDVLAGMFNQNLFLLDGTGLDYTVATAFTWCRGLHYGAQGTYTPHGKCTFIFTIRGDDSNLSAASRLGVLLQNRTGTQHASFQFRFASWWQNRLWGLDNAIKFDDDTVWYSNLFDGGTIPNDQTFKVESGRGGRLMAMQPIRNTKAGAPSAVIFKERLITLLTTYWGTSSGLIPLSSDKLDYTKSSVQIITENFGCIAPLSIQYCPGVAAGEIIFLAHDGFRALNRANDDTISAASMPISASVRDYTDRINLTYAFKAVSAVWDRKYWCAVPLDGAINNNYIFCLDLITGGWSLFTVGARGLVASTQNQTADQLWLQANTWGTDSVSSGPATGWHVYRTFTGLHFPNEENIDYREESRGFMGQAIQQRKRWDWLCIQGYGLTATCVIQVEAKQDLGDWVWIDEVTFPLAGGVYAILAEDALPWVGEPLSVSTRKVDLTELPPSYVLQYSLACTEATEHGRPVFLSTAIRYSKIDPEFDNEIT